MNNIINNEYNEYKKIFTVIGNCQSDCLAHFLLSNSDFSKKYYYLSVKNIHLMDNNELDDLYKNILPVLDLIIIQPISDNYKNDPRYGTKCILKNVDNTCIKILFPSLYFDFYHPFICYIYDKNNPGWKLDSPYDYHDKIILKYYIDAQNESNKIISSDKNEIESFSLNLFNYYKTSLLNRDICDDKILINKFNENIENLKKRENNYKHYVTIDTHLIKSSNFISNNYSKNLLFYSINHPSKYLFHYISDSILVILKIQLGSYPESLDPLKSLIMPLYSCIEKHVKFDVNKYQNFQHYDIILNDNDVINSYIDAYNKVSLNILQENLE
jgi:hypothetical protein